MQNLKPDPEIIKQHIQFLYSDLSAYDDARFEVGGLVHANTENFALADSDKATTSAIALNSKKTNTYIIPATLNPDVPFIGRASDKDIYATNVLWLDIDEPHDPEQLKSLYAACPPNIAVKTATYPHRRLHLYWKLDEPLSDQDTMREALTGLVQNLGGDRSAVNPARLMRLAGTVNYPNEKKQATGRQAELVTLHQINPDARYNIDRLMAIYPVRDYQDVAAALTGSGEGITRNAHASPFLEPQVDDGRDLYMSKMVFASIVNYVQANGCWPEAQEIVEDVWPVYSRRVAERNGRTLDQDNRGLKSLQSKTRSKLRQFINGGMKQYGMGTIEDIIEKKQKNQLKQIENVTYLENDLTKKKDVISQIIKSVPQPMHLIMADDIQPSLDTHDFVQGLLSENQFSVVYGESNCGKTFFMTDLCFHVALGQPWRGKRIEQGGVVYAALEGAYGLRNRIAAFRKHYDTGVGMPFGMIASQLDFLSEDGNISEFIDLLKNEQQRIGNAKLIVIDTLARALMGGDENSGQDMGMLVAHADRIRYETGAHICFIHHSGKDRARGARGHSSLRAAVDTEIEISRDAGADYSTIKIVKQREMEAIEPMYFRLQAVSLGHNRHEEEITSCVVMPLDKTAIEPPDRKLASLTPLQQFVFDALVNAMIDHGESRIVTKGMPAVNCVSYDEFRDHLEEGGFKEIVGSDKIKSATQAARVALKSKGYVNFNRNYIWMLIPQDQYDFEE